MRRRVVLSSNTTWSVVNFRTGLIRALIKAGVEVVVIAPEDRFVPTLLALGCRYIPIEIDNRGSNPLIDLKSIISFWRLLKQEKPDFFLGYTIKPNIYGSLACRFLKITVLNNITGLGTVFIKKSWKTKLVCVLYKRALSSSHTVFFQNPDDQALFIAQRIIRASVAKILPGSGIDLKAYATQSFSQESPPITFLFIARLLWEKGIGEYIEAIRFLKKEHPKIVCGVLGALELKNKQGVTEAQMQEWLDEGVLTYYSEVDDVRPFIKQAACIVLPSYREGTPRVLLEAAAMGKVIITTDAVGCRNVVTDGVNGYLCQVKNSFDLYEKMVKILEMSQEKRFRMGLAGRQKIEQSFSENIVIAKYCEALEVCI